MACSRQPGHSRLPLPHHFRHHHLPDCRTAGRSIRIHLGRRRTTLRRLRPHTGGGKTEVTSWSTDRCRDAAKMDDRGSAMGRSPPQTALPASAATKGFRCRSGSSTRSRRSEPGEIVENKRLGAALAMVKQHQDSYVCDCSARRVCAMPDGRAIRRKRPAETINLTPTQPKWPWRSCALSYAA